MARIEDIEKFNYKTIPIPGNATNGDLILSSGLFKVEKESCDGIFIYVSCVGMPLQLMEFSRDWWNAPYKEKKDGSN